MKEFTDYMINKYDEMLHIVIRSYKPTKTCSLKGNSIGYAQIDDLK